MSVALIFKKWSENVQPGTLRKCYYRNFLGYLPCMLVFTSPIHLNLVSYPFKHSPQASVPKGTEKNVSAKQKAETLQIFTYCKEKKRWP